MQQQQQYHRTSKQKPSYFRLFIFTFFSAVIVFSIFATCVLISNSINENPYEITKFIRGSEGQHGSGFASKKIGLFGIASLDLTLEQYYIRHKLRYQVQVTHPLDVRQPKYYPLGELLTIWPSDDVSIESWAKSPAHPDSGTENGFLPRFDYNNKAEKELALRYRNLELPFLLYNIPELDAAIVNSFSGEKIIQFMGEKDWEVEISASNHFTYFSKKSDKYIRAKKKAKRTGLEIDSFTEDWKPPQQSTVMAFSDFLEKVKVEEENKGHNVHDRQLYYLTINSGAGRATKPISEALTIFEKKKSFFMVNEQENKGINCRFGMKGVAATAHYDGGRNFIAMIRGRKRYIILPPSECKAMHLLPRGHPSARHSLIDWTNVSDVRAHSDFAAAKATEVVLSEGEVLYLPSYWFHYIVSQDMSLQCNARSGSSSIGFQDIEECGFPSDRKHDGPVTTKNSKGKHGDYLHEDRNVHG